MNNRWILRPLALLLALLAMIVITAGCSRQDPADDVELYWPEGLDSGAASDPVEGEEVSVPVVPISGPTSFSKQIEEFGTKNPDAAGWLYLPDTTINEVVVQTDDNEYYHRRSNLKEPLFEGCLYIDFDSRVRGAPEKVATNVVIYGHSMDDNPDGKNFSQLKKLLDKDFAEKHPYIFFSTKEQDFVYEIFSVMYTSDKFYYIDSQPTDEEFAAIIAEAKAASRLNYPVTPVAGDKIITLSTCTYLYGDNEQQRFVVMGRMLIGDDAMAKSVSLEANPTPKEPVFN